MIFPRVTTVHRLGQRTGRASVTVGILLGSLLMGCGGSQSTPTTAAGAQLEQGLDLRHATTEMANTLVQRLRERGAHHRVAVLPVESSTGARCAAADAIAASMTDALLRDADAVTAVVDRQNIKVVLEEQAFSSSDAVAPNHVVQMGQLTGATALLTTTVTGEMDHYILRSRLTSVENGEVSASATAAVRAGDLIGIGGCGSIQVENQFAAVERVYGRDTGAHKVMITAALTSLIAASVAGGVSIYYATSVKDKCASAADCESADKTVQTAAFVAAGAAGVSLLSLGIYYLIPPARPTSPMGAARPPAGVFTF